VKLKAGAPCKAPGIFRTGFPGGPGFSRSHERENSPSTSLPSQLDVAPGCRYGVADLGKIGMAKSVSEQVRIIRKEKKLTLKALSAACGLSISTLSKLENGRARLSLETAMILANVLQVPVTALLARPSSESRSRRSITRAGGGTHHSQPGMDFEVLCSDLKEKRNVFWRVTVVAQTIEACGGWRKHPGEEFLHIISGTLELHTEHYEPIRLAMGDSILFDADMGHAYLAVGDEPVILIMSNTVPANATNGRDDLRTIVGPNGEDGVYLLQR
jgi:transcriptional regulator with XRE-family HTH domain